jgi:hypothetical protein
VYRERSLSRKNRLRRVGKYYVAAYIWPSCHDDPLARGKLWSEGIGEWEVIKKGNPRFEGHYQPRMPLWGYELDNDPKVVEKWIDVATDHGVNIFVYDWYWYEEGPYLESALNDGFLKARNNSKMQFYIMWANHDVKYNYWNVHRYGDNTDILWNAKVDRKNYEIIVDRVINQYYNTPQSFATLLSKAKQYADSHPEQPKLITINAWNEWVEGSYLLPDMLNGFGYLEAVKSVIIDGKYDKY